MKRAILPLLLLLPALLVAQSGVPWDASGNGLLQGVYNFRQVVWVVNSDAGNFGQTVTLHGKITFDGNGAYELDATVFDSDVGSQQSLRDSGTYRISAGGHGFLSSPVLDDGAVFGVVSQGIFVGSSTEDGLNDFFVAAPEGSAQPTAESFSGNYWIAEMNFPSLTPAQARDAMFRIAPNGQGGLGSISARGFIGGTGRPVTQTIAGATYSFANGIGTIAYGGTPSNTTLMAGNRIFYLSPDGNFLFGGSMAGADFFAGVRALPEPPAAGLFSGLFLNAGVDIDQSNLADGFSTIHTYYGAIKADLGNQIAHQRVISGFDSAAFDYTYSDVYDLDADGRYDDFLGFRHVIGAGGTIRIGSGQETVLGLDIGFKAPVFASETLAINPASVVNAASFTPFTVGVSRGASIIIEGAKLAETEASDPTLPRTLGGVEVFVNDRPAPIRSVSSTRVVAQVPFGTTESVASIRLLSNGVESNRVTAFVSQTTPGVYTDPEGGIGYAVAFRPDSTRVTADNPARPGEVIAIHVNGLGDVDPAVAEGVQTPSEPSINATAGTAAYLDGEEADVMFAGLAPGLVGVYLMSIRIPAGIDPGDLYLDIGTPDAYTSQVQLPVGTRVADERSSRRAVPGKRTHLRRPSGRRAPAIERQHR